MLQGKNAVWVVTESFKGQILEGSLEITGQGRKLADSLRTSLEVVFFGHDIASKATIFVAAGADTVYLAESPFLQYYQSEYCLEIITKLVEKQQPQILLLSSTVAGREWASLVAARLGTGLSAHCIDLEIDEMGRLVQWIPAYGGLAGILCPEKRPQMATIAPGVFPKPQLNHMRKGRIVPLCLPRLEDQRVKTLEVVREKEEANSLEKAEIVVAGGAGAGDRAGWDLIADLARALGGALGATRPPVDEGWIEEDKMIGQSGKTVSPSLYIGLGVSGELQHTVGIRSAKLSVAINKDPKAPIFDQVDFGVIDDLREFIPAFIGKIKKHTSR